jgi:hypothetical protein
MGVQLHAGEIKLSTKCVPGVPAHMCPPHKTHGRVSPPPPPPPHTHTFNLHLPVPTSMRSSMRTPPVYRTSTTPVKSESCVHVRMRMRASQGERGARCRGREAHDAGGERRRMQGERGARCRRREAHDAGGERRTMQEERGAGCRGREAHDGGGERRTMQGEGEHGWAWHREGQVGIRWAWAHTRKPSLHSSGPPPSPRPLRLHRHTHTRTHTHAGAHAHAHTHAKHAQHAKHTFREVRRRMLEKYGASWSSVNSRMRRRWTKEGTCGRAWKGGGGFAAGREQQALTLALEAPERG